MAGSAPAASFPLVCPVGPGARGCIWARGLSLDRCVGADAVWLDPDIASQARVPVLHDTTKLFGACGETIKDRGTMGLKIRQNSAGIVKPIAGCDQQRSL